MNRKGFRNFTTQLPAKAQDGVFSFLFNIIDLITALLGLFGLLGDLFMPRDEDNGADDA